MKGGPLAERVRAEVADEVRELGQVGLATVQVGEDPGSTIYIRRKHEAAHEAGMRSVDLKLTAETPQEELVAGVAELNEDDGIDGILVQLPLPRGLDEAAAVAAIDPVKDVDGIMALLAEHRVKLDGARAVVIGRSDIVGKPVAHLLLQAHATVTICHSHTDDLARETLDADVLVVAAGVPEIVTADMVKSGAAVVDVGINRTESGLVGDVAADVAEVAAFLTPVPGGVGPMTIAMLLQNTVRAARFRRRLLAFPGVRG